MSDMLGPSVGDGYEAYKRWVASKAKEQEVQKYYEKIKEAFLNNYFNQSFNKAALTNPHRRADNINNIMMMVGKTNDYDLDTVAPGIGDHPMTRRELVGQGWLDRFDPSFATAFRRYLADQVAHPASKYPGLVDDLVKYGERALVRPSRTEDFDVTSKAPLDPTGFYLRSFPNLPEDPIKPGLRAPGNEGIYYEGGPERLRTR